MVVVVVVVVVVVEEEEEVVEVVVEVGVVDDFLHCQYYMDGFHSEMFLEEPIRVLLSSLAMMGWGRYKI